MGLNFFKSKTAGNIYFSMVFVLLFFYYGLNETMFYPPQSVHIWRQTNCLSVAQQYYQNNLPLFQPEMHNQLCDDGMSGNAVGEFPIVYFVVAKLWKLFGKHEWIFKLVQISILFLGLLSLFHVVQRILKNMFWAGFVSLLIFTSPMVIYYGPNFLPDVPALSFVFMAWLFVLKFLDKRKCLNLWLAAILFCMAMLLKITSAISFIALGGWVIFELFQEKQNRKFQFRFKHYVPFLVAAVLVVMWYFYADSYNQIHKGHISYHGIWPVWNMTKEQLSRILDILDKIYFKELFLPFAQYLTFGIWVFLMISFKKLTPVFRFMTIVLPLGFLIEMLLWFQVLEGHDYYTINLLVVWVALWIIFLAQVLKVKSKVKYVIYILAVVFFVFNVVECKTRAEGRYVGWMNDNYKKNLEPLISIEPFFVEWGIDKEDKVISIPDLSINGSLYYMNRKGYTEFASDFSKAEGFYQRIENGAKYLIVNDTTILNREYLAPFIQNKLGEHDNIFVYDLQNIESDKNE
jgi:hypothetical protein